MTYMRPNDETKLQQGGPWTQYMPETRTQQGTFKFYLLGKTLIRCISVSLP